MYNLFEKRDKTVTNLIKLGDSIARSLRENVIIFNIDAEDKKVSYVTESKKVITGSYSISPVLKLKNIVVEDIELFTNNKKFDKFLNKKINRFLSNIYEDKYTEASSNFYDVLNLWEDRLKIKNVASKLDSKVAKLSEEEKIITSPEFTKFLELAPNLINYLKEHKDKISNIGEIINGIKLVKTVTEAFDFPKITYDDLSGGSYTYKSEYNDTIYNMICKQELVRNELVEHKRNFDTLWIKNGKVTALAGLVESTDSVEVAKALAEAITEIPYLALASKKQLTEVFNSILSNNNQELPIPVIQKFSSVIFELNKPIRKNLISMLNEKYGINVLNLKEEFTFKSLINTEIVIFESLARLSPRGSVQRDVLLETSKMLKSKNGIEAIDVANVLEEIFQSADYKVITEMDMGMGRYLDFNKIANDLGSVSQILKSIQGMAGGGDTPMGGGLAGTAPQMGGPQMGGAPGMAPAPMNKGNMPLGSEDDNFAAPGNDAMGPEGEEEGMMDPAGMGQEDPLDDEPSMNVGKEEVVGLMQELEQILQSLKGEIGLGDEMGGMSGEEEGEEDFNGGAPNFDGEESEEGGDDSVDVDTGDGDDEVHIDVTDGEHNMEDDSEEEGEEGDEPEEAPPKKDKKESKGKPPPFKKGGNK